MFLPHGPNAIAFVLAAVLATLPGWGAASFIDTQGRRCECACSSTSSDGHPPRSIRTFQTLSDGVQETVEPWKMEVQQEGSGAAGNNASFGDAVANTCTPAGKAEAATIAEQKFAVRLVIAVAMGCLLVMLFSGYLMERFHFLWLPEAGIGILCGILVSFFMQLFKHNDALSILRFDPEFFYIFLLPPIIFEAGYNMRRQAFFRNIGAICIYAFLGTTISTFVVGGIVFASGRVGLGHPIGAIAALVFGAIISATDPISTLAVFQQLRANADLYALVFGESALNDAVAIVMYNTLTQLKCGVTGAAIGLAFGTFLLTFVSSTLIGFAVGATCALFTKYLRMRDRREFLFYELTVMSCFPYLAFTIAEALGMSGIVAILFCGCTMAHFACQNLSKQAADASRGFFKTVAKLAESFVFIYLGFALFSFKQTWHLYRFFLISFAACLLARLLNTYPCSLLINLFRKKEARIPQKAQFVIWYGGLRGAVAFLMAVESRARNQFPEIADPVNYPGFTDSDVILTTTLFISVVSVFSMGGTVGWVLTKFDLRELEIEQYQSAYGGFPGVMGRGRTPPLPNAGLVYLDRRYLTPFLTIRKWTPDPEDTDAEGPQPDETSVADVEMERPSSLLHDRSENDDGDEAEEVEPKEMGIKVVANTDLATSSEGIQLQRVSSRRTVRSAPSSVPP